VHREGGQATVEWVALVLAAALVLGAAAAFAGREADRGVGEAIAKRITKTARQVGRGSAAGVAGPTAPAPGAAAPGAPAPGAAAPGPPAPRAGAPPPSSSPLSFLSRAIGGGLAGIGGRLAGIGEVAKHGWIVCLGYERWKHELEHPSAPTEPLPADVALSIVNTCFNPHDYLLED
jgi:hypothetical protein